MTRKKCVRVSYKDLMALGPSPDIHAVEVARRLLAVPGHAGRDKLKGFSRH